MLRIENLTKTYGEKRAVDNLSLHIAPGEIYGFIGHNGAGKNDNTESGCRGFFNLIKAKFSLKENPSAKIRLPANKKLLIFRIIRICMNL